MRATMHKLHTALQPATPLQEDVIDLGEGARGTVLSFEATERDCAWCAACSIDGTSWELEAWNGPSVEAPHTYAALVSSSPTMPWPHATSTMRRIAGAYVRPARGTTGTLPRLTTTVGSLRRMACSSSADRSPRAANGCPAAGVGGGVGAPAAAGGVLRASAARSRTLRAWRSASSSCAVGQRPLPGRPSGVPTSRVAGD